MIVPKFSEELLDQPLQEQLEISGNKVLFSDSRARDLIIEEISRLVGVESVQGGSAPNTPSEIRKDLENDFLAFGYAVLQIQQMARKLRYSFNLDWMIVSDQIIQGACNFNQGKYDEADRW
ncbi:MAG: hypothetical protein ACKOAH_11945, partial [Pirellula sp.]